MNGFLAVSFWIALVTVVPGLITIATVFGAVVLVEPTYVSGLDTNINQGLWGAIAITVMILTQAFGILLEDKLVSRGSLGEEIEVPETFFDSMESLSDSKWIDPYEEYQFLYFLLVRLGEDDDIHGHLERAVAQFFLSNNTLVSFAAGIVATGGILIMSLLTQGFVPVTLARGGVYAGLLVVALFISFRCDYRPIRSNGDFDMVAQKPAIVGSITRRVTEQGPKDAFPSESSRWKIRAVYSARRF